ncbi:substrate-binding domain-containing protein [Streptomyces sp. Root369]|uniref:substrate-binding domain-containing protein n=1 Tax=Streptomyces sp. Root369 TaxID=1736523 RepID=UPI000B0DB456|nr:substrate-binding domain-containing protein [Streptomyces sp. Root369]
MGVLEAFTEAGLSVPGDISVAGYDNTTFAAFGPLSLTSVDQAGTEIGRNAARLLLERIADRRKTSVQVKPSPSLVPRRTTAPPRSRATHRDLEAAFNRSVECGFHLLEAPSRRTDDAKSS